MTFVIILLAVALVLSLAFNFGFLGGKPATTNTNANHSSPIRQDSKSSDADARATKAENELEKKRKELEEARKALAENKDELKNTKKKLHDQRENDKNGDDLKKARAEVERQASIQLDATRAELATALAEIQKMKTEFELKGKKFTAAAVEKKAEEPSAPPPQVVIQKVIRELSDSDKERMAKLEAQSSNDRKKANELERENKNLKSKFDKHTRDTKAIYADANLSRDKFRAVEKRLNRTLFEMDLIRRSLFDLEKKTGQQAERSTMTAEEVIASDTKIDEKHASEDKAAADSKAKLEAAEATAMAAETPAPAPAISAPTPTA